MAKDNFGTSGIIFHQFINNLNTQILAMATKWEITTEEIAAYTPALDAYNDAYDIVADPTTNTPVARAELNITKVTITRIMRPFVQNRLYGNVLVSIPDLISCMLVPHSTSRARIGKPSGMPQFGFTQNNSGHSVKGTYYNTPAGSQPGKKVRGKPKGVHHLELVWILDPDPSDDPDTYTNSLDFSSNPMILEFTAADKGKTVTMYARWVTSTGIKGDWTIVAVTVTIP